MRKPNPAPPSSPPDLDPGACEAYAVEPGARWRKVAPESPLRLPYGSVADSAKAAEVDPRTIKRVARTLQWAPDLEAALMAGSLSAVAANDVVKARLHRANVWRACIAVAFYMGGDDRRGAMVERLRIETPADLWRWLRSRVAAYSDESPDLSHARAVTGAAILGYDPVETGLPSPR